MDEVVKQALEKDLIIDITTQGSKSGKARKTEIWFHNIDGRLYITGTPGRRHWLANLIANPEFTFHLKESAQADLPARARPIFKATERRDVLSAILRKLSKESDLEARVKGAPLIEVELQTD